MNNEIINRDMIEVERKKDIPLVTVRCTVYNHEKYLRNCLDGIVMQKTNFVFHAIVHDDASTDKSAVIIKEYATRYPTIIKPIFEMENQYSKGGEFLSRIMEEHTLGKYVAYCEGDDYWTDPYKLQKEVDILERNNNVKLVYTSYSNVDEDGNLIIRPAYERNKRISHSGNILGELFNRNFVMTVTVCLRKDILDTELYKNCKWKYDYSFTFAASMLGEVVYLPDDTSCYRLNPNSLTQVKRKQVLGDLEKIKEYYALALLNNEGSSSKFSVLFL